MKLLVNATPLIPPLSGIGRYTQQLLLNLFTESAIEDIDGFVPFAFYSRQELLTMVHELEHEDEVSSSRATVPLSNIAQLKRVARKIPAARYLKQQLQQLLIGKKFKQYKDHIYWESNYVLTPFDGVKVATIYDLSHIRYPDFHPSDRLKWLDEHLPETIADADALVAISEFSKQEIISVFNVAAEKISIVPPAVAPVFRQKYSDTQLQQVQQLLQLPEQYVLSVGTLEPRKNIKGLVQAFSRLPQSLRKAYPLVLAGAKGWHTAEIEAVLKPLLNSGEVILLGYVAQQHIPILYAGATVLAYVSHYEGYGMPVAEAMCSNTAVLTSNVASMPEVAADCAQLVDPNDIEQITEQLRELLEDQSKRENLQQRAKKVSDNYRWENSARRLVQVFQTLA